MVLLVLVAISFNIYARVRPSFAVADTFADYGGAGSEADEAFVSTLAARSVPDDFLGFVVLDSTSVLDAPRPLSGALPDRSGLMIYKVKGGDTLSGIAANFGISLDTILGTNPDLKGASLKPGQELVILPVSGMLHSVQEGDTLDGLAALYNVSPDSIMQVNPRLSELLAGTGNSIIIPGANLGGSRAALSYRTKDLPKLASYFIIPTTGWNWGILHNYNAVDIANTCGTPVYAAAEGLVAEEFSKGWNGGYGSLVKIEHPNKTVTLYAHLSKTVAKLGDYVLQGDLVGYIGNTGKTHGPTGCHLHFEVYGAQNPFQR